MVVACGTSYHAGLVGRYAIEEWARVPVEMDIASEFRYRNPVIDERDLVIGITQSGETADTLAAMRLARERGASVLAITNVMGSQATRDADGVLFTRAGLEIGGRRHQDVRLAGVGDVPARRSSSPRCAARCRPSASHELVAEVKQLPHQISELLGRIDEPIREIAEHWADAGFFLYLGRHVGLPVCLEGALKLKEISYIPTDAYAAGRDEARPDRAARRAHAGGLRGHPLAGARQGAVEHRRGPRARRARDRRGHRGRRRRRPSTRSRS